MVLQRLLRIEKDEKGFKVKIRWRGLGEEEDTYEPLAQVIQDVPRLVMKLLDRKMVPKQLAKRAKQYLNHLNRGV